MARYSSKLPSGSRKYAATAGIQAMTTGSSAGAPSKSSGVMPAAFSARGAARTRLTVALKADRPIQIGNRQVRLEQPLDGERRSGPVRWLIHSGIIAR